MEPTQAELNTFMVMANNDFTDLDKEMLPRQRTPSVVSSVSTEKEIFPEKEYEFQEKFHEKVPEKFDPKSEEFLQEQAAFKSVSVDVELEKEALLQELYMMEKQGMKLNRTMTMNDSLESLQYQYDRMNSMQSTQQTVEWAKTGIKMGSGLLEMSLKKFGLGMVDGFSNNLCKDMNKFNRPMTKLVRKYWRKGSTSPEWELGMIIFGSLAMTVFQNRGLKSEPLARPTTVPEPPVFKRPTPEPPVFKRPAKPEFVSSPMSSTLPVVNPVLPQWARETKREPQIIKEEPVSQVEPVPQAPLAPPPMPQVPQVPLAQASMSKKISLSPRSTRSPRSVLKQPQLPNLDINF